MPAVRGLGQAPAHRLAGLGTDMVVDRAADGVKRLATEIEQCWGAKAHAVQADVTDWDDVHRFIRDSHDLLARSLIDTVYCSRAVLDYMIPQGSGRIINVASEAARNISPGMAVYGAAKAGVIHFTRCLANEVGELGIHVNGVAPGTMLKSDLQEMLRDPEGMGRRRQRRLPCGSPSWTSSASPSRKRSRT